MKRTSGFSLVEVVIASAVLTIVAAGICSVTMLTSRIAYSNIYEYTAHTVANAYGEQIKSISFSEIKKAMEDPKNHSIPTESLSLGSSKNAQNLKISDPLVFGSTLDKDIVVDIEQEDGSVSERVMKMTFLATGRDLMKETDQWDAIEITLDYTWNMSDRSGVISNSGQVMLVKTNVTEY